jgi:hypothetical protein
MFDWLKSTEGQFLTVLERIAKGIEDHNTLSRLAMHLPPLPTDPEEEFPGIGVTHVSEEEAWEQERKEQRELYTND